MSTKCTLIEDGRCFRATPEAAMADDDRRQRFLETDKAVIARESLGESVSDFIVGTGDFFTENRARETAQMNLGSDPMSQLVGNLAYFIGGTVVMTGEAVGESAARVNVAKSPLERQEAIGELIVAGTAALNLAVGMANGITPSSPKGFVPGNNAMSGGMGMVTTTGMVFEGGPAAAATAMAAGVGGLPSWLGGLAALSQMDGKEAGASRPVWASKPVKVRTQEEFDATLKKCDEAVEEEQRRLDGQKAEEYKSYDLRPQRELRDFIEDNSEFASLDRRLWVFDYDVAVAEGEFEAAYPKVDFYGTSREGHYLGDGVFEYEVAIEEARLARAVFIRDNYELVRDAGAGNRIAADLARRLGDVSDSGPRIRFGEGAVFETPQDLIRLAEDHLERGFMRRGDMDTTYRFMVGDKEVTRRYLETGAKVDVIIVGPCITNVAMLNRAADLVIIEFESKSVLAVGPTGPQYKLYIIGGPYGNTTAGVGRYGLYSIQFEPFSQAMVDAAKLIAIE